MAQTQYLIEKFKGTNKNRHKHYWRLKHNGKVLVSSEGIINRKARDKVVDNLAKAFVIGKCRVVDLEAVAEITSAKAKPKKKKAVKPKPAAAAATAPTADPVGAPGGAGPVEEVGPGGEGDPGDDEVEEDDQDHDDESTVSQGDDDED